MKKKWIETLEWSPKKSLNDFKKKPKWTPKETLNETLKKP